MARARRLGRKGWLSLFRDATVFKVAYAWGLRRQEVRRLEVCDFGVNPKAVDFGAYGACYVRFAKGAHGSGPRRRTVLTVMPWSVDIIGEWVEHVRCEYEPGVNQALWPSERSPVVSEHQLNARFAQLRERVGLTRGMGMHCRSGSRNGWASRMSSPRIPWPSSALGKSTWFTSRSLLVKEPGVRPRMRAPSATLRMSDRAACSCQRSTHPTSPAATPPRPSQLQGVMSHTVNVGHPGAEATAAAPTNKVRG